jgi:hypothetical protein
VSKRTQVILLCAAVVLIAMCLFPPQSVEYAGTFVAVNYEKHGYFFIGKDWSELPARLRPQIEYGTLALQVALVCLSTGALLLFLSLLDRRKRGRVHS